MICFGVLSRKLYAFIYGVDIVKEFFFICCLDDDKSVINIFSTDMGGVMMY